MIDDAAGFVLPLVYHLVQQGVQRLGPAVPAQVAPADRDLRRLARSRGGIVAQAGLHAP